MRNQKRPKQKNDEKTDSIFNGLPDGHSNTGTDGQHPYGDVAGGGGEC